MIRSALLLCAALLTALAFACVAPIGGPPPAPPPVGGGPPTIAATWPIALCNAANFAGNVTILDAGFDPTANPYVPPHGAVQPGGMIKQDLQDAFNIAPLVVQQHLCALSGVFINPTLCTTNPCNAGGLFGNSWGFRSQQGTDKGQTYIAISGQLWATGGHAVAFPAYENAILQYLVAKLGLLVGEIRQRDQVSAVQNRQINPE